jgi:hypothetical protein
MTNQVAELREKFGELKGDMKNVLGATERIEAGMTNLVNRYEFRPVKAIVYGLVSAVMLAFLGTILLAIRWKA